jgi:hypothetical protein
MSIQLKNDELVSITKAAMKVVAFLFLIVEFAYL